MGNEKNFNPNRMVTQKECTDRKTRWVHNIEALKHDTEAQIAMMAVRQERLDVIEKQDLACVKRLRRRGDFYGKVSKYSGKQG